MSTFDSGDNKRVENNPVLPETYSGPDDVSMNYHALTDEEKKKMGEIKLRAQLLINDIRSLGTHPDIALAIRKAQESSMWAVKYITASSKITT